VEFKYLHEGKGGQALFGNGASPPTPPNEAWEHLSLTGGAAWDPGGAACSRVYGAATAKATGATKCAGTVIPVPELSVSSGAGHHDAYILAGGLNVREKRVRYPALYIALAATVGTPLFLQLRTDGALPADEDFN